MKAALRLTALAVALCLAGPVAAQKIKMNGGGGGFAIGANGGFYTLSGDDFETTDAGFGLNGFVRYNFPSGFSISGGFQWNTHNDDFIGESITIIGVIVDPRYYFQLKTPTVTPFVGGRAGYLRESVTVAGFDLSASGFAFGGTGGILFQASPQFAIETTVSFQSLSFGDVDVDGTTVPNTDASGTSLGISAGLVISFPK